MSGSFNFLGWRLLWVFSNIVEVNAGLKLTDEVSLGVDTRVGEQRLKIEYPQVAKRQGQWLGGRLEQELKDIGLSPSAIDWRISGEG